MREKSTLTDEYGDHLYLTHLLLPSYFKDASLKDDVKAPEKLHMFLKEAANFYKDLYAQTTSNSSVKVRLVIPHVSHFITAMNQAETMEKAKTNTEVLQTELVDVVGCDNGFVLLNQETEALKPIAASLQQQGTPKVTGTGIPIFNAYGYATTKFIPYILNKGKEYHYQTSPLLTQTLLEHVQKQTKEKKHD